MTGRRPAVFLDRDGTVIHDAHFIARPDQVALIAGAAAAIGRLNAAGLPVVIVSNQSGIGRGYLTRDDFARVEERVEQLLAAEGARVDAVYICPHAPAPDGRAVCACRKPGTELYRRAGSEHDLDLARSWYVGDRWRDVAPAGALGGGGILVPTDQTRAEDVAAARAGAEVAASLADAVDRILAAR